MKVFLFDERVHKSKEIKNEKNYSNQSLEQEFQ